MLPLTENLPVDSSVLKNFHYGGMRFILLLFRWRYFEPCMQQEVESFSKLFDKVSYILFHSILSSYYHIQDF